MVDKDWDGRVEFWVAFGNSKVLSQYVNVFILFESGNISNLNAHKLQLLD